LVSESDDIEVDNNSSFLSSDTNGNMHVSSALHTNAEGVGAGAVAKSLGLDTDLDADERFWEGAEREFERSDLSLLHILQLASQPLFELHMNQTLARALRSQAWSHKVLL
jgi:hypothetical protein